MSLRGRGGLLAELTSILSKKLPNRNLELFTTGAKPYALKRLG